MLLKCSGCNSAGSSSSRKDIYIEMDDRNEHKMSEVSSLSNVIRLMSSVILRTKAFSDSEPKLWGHINCWLLTLVSRCQVKSTACSRRGTQRMKDEKTGSDRP